MSSPGSPYCRKLPGTALLNSAFPTRRARPDSACNWSLQAAGKSAGGVILWPRLYSPVVALRIPASPPVKALLTCSKLCCLPAIFCAKFRLPALMPCTAMSASSAWAASNGLAGCCASAARVASGPPGAAPAGCPPGSGVRGSKPKAARNLLADSRARPIPSPASLPTASRMSCARRCNSEARCRLGCRNSPGRLAASPSAAVTVRAGPAAAGCPSPASAGASGLCAPPALTCRPSRVLPAGAADAGESGWPPGVTDGLATGAVLPLTGNDDGMFHAPPVVVQRRRGRASSMPPHVVGGGAPPFTVPAPGTDFKSVPHIPVG